MGDWTVITVAGTSLVNKGREAVAGWKARSGGARETQMPQLSATALAAWFREQTPSDQEKLSSEFKSAAVMARTPEFRGGRLYVHLLASETEDGRLEAQALARLGEWAFPHSVAEFCFDPNKDCIPGLQVSDRRRFVYEGLPVLIRRLSEIAQHSPGSVVVNCTSGFRSTVPYLTAFALIHNLRMVYVFEGSGELLTIPGAPLTLDWALVEKHLPAFEALQEGIVRPVAEVAQSQPYSELARHGLVEGDDQLTVLSALGEILLARYRSQYALVRIDSRMVHELFDAPQWMRRVIAEKFCDPKRRDERTEKKNGHYVYDDGNNCNRIYYVKDAHGFPVIYKLFWSDHKDHDRYYRERKPPGVVPSHRIYRIDKQTGELEEVTS
ncbi:MAG: hypothetical protein IRZ33_06585 [Alicyclobacillaceae bacterium]|nr:hypothetical protein [Alicyclobacillaceae bacterium]